MSTPRQHLIILREHDRPGGQNIDLIRDTALSCRNLGYHVIVEVILYERHYGDMLRRLYSEHVGPKRAFSLDLPLETTLLRHETKSLRADVPPETLAEWFQPHDVLGLPDEVVLDSSGLSEADTLQFLISSIGDVECLRPEKE